MDDNNNLNPAYLQGLTASNRLTDARGEVYRLLTVLPSHKRSAVIRIYNQLCSVQGALENQLKDVPVTVESEPGGNDGKES